MPFSSSNTPNSYRPLIRFLDTNGDGTGTKNATGNYSASATSFFIQPPINSIYMLTQFFIQLSDAGGFVQNVYGSLATALTNGLLIRAYRGSTLTLDLTDGIPVKNNDNFLHLSEQTFITNWSGGADSLTCTFDTHTFGVTFPLNGTYLDKLEVVCNDDFTGLVDQTFLVRGYII
jgi:hypothetical protein